MLIIGKYSGSSFFMMIKGNFRQNIMFAFCCDILRMGVGGQRHQTIPKIGDVLSDLSNVHAEWPSEYCSYCFCSIHSTN